MRSQLESANNRNSHQRLSLDCLLSFFCFKYIQVLFPFVFRFLLKFFEKVFAIFWFGFKLNKLAKAEIFYIIFVAIF